MENNTSHRYFSEHALKAFVNAEGQKVDRIVCHLWLNTVSQDSKIEIIDNLSLSFEDGKVLTIGCDEDGEALDVIDFDYEQTTKALREEFGDKIRLFAIDASGTRMWQDVKGQTLQHVKLTKSESHYLSDAIVLDFGTEKREIRVAPLDGLLIDYYEE